MSKLAAPVVAAGRRVLGKVVVARCALGLLDPVHAVVDPFVQLRLGAHGHAALETGEADGDLDRVDDDTLDWHVEDCAASKSVHRHLSVGLELVEVVARDRSLGRLLIHDVQVVVVVDEAVKVAGENYAVVHIQREAVFDCRLAVAQVYDRSGVVLEMLGIPDDGADQGLARLVRVAAVPRLACGVLFTTVPRVAHCLVDDEAQGFVSIEAQGEVLVEMLERGSVVAAEANVKALQALPPTLNVLELVVLQAGLRRRDAGSIPSELHAVAVERLVHEQPVVVPQSLHASQ